MNTQPMRRLLHRGGLLGLLLVGIFLLLAYLWLRRRAVLVALLLLAVVLGVLYALTPPFRRHPFTTTLTVLDVGKGDALVLESPGGKVLVVDAGKADSPRRAILPHLRRRGIRRIDTLVLTHPHPDHVGGAAALLRAVPVGQVVHTGVEGPDENRFVRDYTDAAAEHGVPLVTALRGARLAWDSRVEVDILHPADARRGEGVPINDTSLVLRVAFGGTAFLLPGDAGAGVEDALRRARLPLRADVLKVAHHGSAQATTEAFLRTVRPAHAVITVSATNRGGYPAPETVRRLEAAGATVWRSDRDGTVTFASDGRRVRVLAATAR